MKCRHEAWEESRPASPRHTVSRTCADCRVYLGDGFQPDPSWFAATRTVRRVDTATAADGSPGESERRACEGWTEPLTVPSGPYYCDARAGMFTLVAYRADRNGGGLYKLWAWEVYGPGWVSVARSDRRVPLVEAQLAAEDAAASLLVDALLALGETGREAMRRAMKERR